MNSWSGESLAMFSKFCIPSYRQSNNVRISYIFKHIQEKMEEFIKCIYMGKNHTPFLSLWLLLFLLSFLSLSIWSWLIFLFLISNLDLMFVFIHREKSNYCVRVHQQRRWLTKKANKGIRSNKIESKDKTNPFSLLVY